MNLSGLGPVVGPSDEISAVDDELDPTAPPGTAVHSPAEPAVADISVCDPTVPDLGVAVVTGNAAMQGDRREPVEITWHGSEPKWVSPHSEWRAFCSGPELLSRVVELVNAGSGRTGQDWALQVDLTKIPLRNLREFNMLFREAADESDAAPNQLEVRTTRHLRAVWTGQWLREITGDQEWLSRVGRQAISEELSEVARLPQDTDTGHAARDRLFNFIGGTHD